MMNRNPLNILIAVIVLGGAGQLMAAVELSADVSFETALAQYRQAVRWPEEVRLEAVERVERRIGGANLKGVYSIGMTKRGNHVDGLSIYHDDPPAVSQGSGRAEGVEMKVRIVFDQGLKRYLDYQVGFANGARKHESISQFATTADGYHAAMGILSSGQALSGYVDGDGNKHLADAMAEGTHRTIRYGRLPGVEEKLLVLEVDTPAGHHVLWLDPQAGCLPRQIEVTCTRRDQYNGGKLPEGIVRQRLMVSECRYETQGEFFIPVHAATTIDRVDQKGQTLPWKLIFDVRKVNLNPKPLKGEFHLDAPDGTEVFPVHPTGASYEWRNGRIVEADKAGSRTGSTSRTSRR